MVHEPQEPPMILEEMSPYLYKISSPEGLRRKALLGIAYNEMSASLKSITDSGKEARGIGLPNYNQ